MKYIDLHCDALSKRGERSVGREALQKGDCLLQVFAAFVHGERLFSQAMSQFEAFDALPLHKVRNGSEIRTDCINALLSVEDGGALEGREENLELFYERGVRIMTLTWNKENELGSPNFTGDLGRRQTEKGLFPFGREIVERMCDLHMAIDVSHGSDKLLEDVAKICKERGVPFLASHSDAAEVFPHARNLKDEQIRRIAESGGVIGLAFCMDFLSLDNSKEGQRDALLRHAKHIMDVGGEDVLCFGSDFDGMPQNSYIKGPESMPAFIEELQKAFSPRVAEKIVSQNALRFFRDVL